MYPLTDLRSARIQKGLSQEDLAKNLLGVRPSTLHFIETGKSVPKRNTRSRIESILGPVNWRKTLASDDRDHILHAMTEIVNESGPGNAIERIRYLKKILTMIEKTL